MIVKMNNKFRNMYVYMCIYLDIIKIVKTLYIDSWVFDYLISKTMLIVFFGFFLCKPNRSDGQLSVFLNVGILIRKGTFRGQKINVFHTTVIKMTY